jgi:hypothetical protein
MLKNNQKIMDQNKKPNKKPLKKDKKQVVSGVTPIIEASNQSPYHIPDNLRGLCVDGPGARNFWDDLRR